MEQELKKALETVWRLAERKHQDECYDEPCTYCAALSKVANAFPELDCSRIEYYRET